MVIASSIYSNIDDKSLTTLGNKLCLCGISLICFSLINSVNGKIDILSIVDIDNCVTGSNSLILSISSSKNSILIGLSTEKGKISNMYPRVAYSPVFVTRLSFLYPSIFNLFSNSLFLYIVPMDKSNFKLVHSFLLGKNLKYPIKFVIIILFLLDKVNSFNVSILLAIKSGDVATASLIKKSSIGNNKTSSY